MPDSPLDVSAIVKLATRARAAISKFDEFGAARPGSRQELRERSAELGVVAAARLAAHVGALGLVRDVRRWTNSSPLYDEPISVAYELMGALTVAVSEGLDPALLEPLLPTLADWQIAKVAQALDPERASDLELLQRLADDPRAAVSAAACRRLGPRRAWCWYAGIFEDDPIPAHADEPAVVEAITRARVALGRERPEAKSSNAQALCAAVDPLAPALAIPLLEAGLLVFPDPGAIGPMGSLGSSRSGPKSDDGPVLRLHALGGTAAVLHALDRLAQAHGDPNQALQRAAAWCGQLPEPARVELALGLLPWVKGEGEGESAADASKSQGAARLVAALWPDTLAPLPLVECFVQGEGSFSLAFYILKNTIEETRADLEAHADQLLELAHARARLVSDLPQLFGLLGRTLSLPRLATMVEAAAGSSDGALQSWALEQRTGRLAPSSPAERQALADTWLEDPAMRKSILSSPVCRARLLPSLRQRLRAGTLTLPMATATMIAIGQLYGGVVEVVSWGLGRRRDSTELEAAERRAQARAELGAWLDPPSGPPSAQEWTNLRALAREALEVVDRPQWNVLAVLPVGPWTVEDLALLDALEGHSLPTAAMGPVMLHHLRGVLEGAPPPDAAARAKRLLAAWLPHVADDSGLDLGWLRQLADGADEHSPAPTKTATDWMDEEDLES